MFWCQKDWWTSLGDLFRNASSHGPEARDAPHGPSCCSRTDAQWTGSTSGPARCLQTPLPQCSAGGHHAPPHPQTPLAHTRTAFSESLELSVILTPITLLQFLLKTVPRDISLLLSPTDVPFPHFKSSAVPLFRSFSAPFLFCSLLTRFHCYVVCFVLIIKLGPSGRATCQCCDLLSTMLQMGACVHSGSASVSSPPADLQSASSLTPFPNTPQVRSQAGLWLGSRSGMWLIY